MSAALSVAIFSISSVDSSLCFLPGWRPFFVDFGLSAWPRTHVRVVSSSRESWFLRSWRTVQRSASSPVMVSLEPIWRFENLVTTPLLSRASRIRWGHCVRRESRHLVTCMSNQLTAEITYHKAINAKLIDDISVSLPYFYNFSISKTVECQLTGPSNGTQVLYIFGLANYNSYDSSGYDSVNTGFKNGSNEMTAELSSGA